MNARRHVTDVAEIARAAFATRMGRPPDVVAAAPGRINLIGDHTDYNAGLALPFAIDRCVVAAVGHGGGHLFSVSFGQSQTTDGCNRDGWAAYPRGVAWALAGRGYRLGPWSGTVAGNVPVGSGLSSSAALETAVALALSALFGLSVPPRELAQLCQIAENQFVGVHIGIMDQLSSLLSREGSALLIDFETLDTRPIPFDLERAGLELLVCDTREERRLAGSGYNDRRQACEAAARLLSVPSLRRVDAVDLERLPLALQPIARHVVTENARVLAAVEALESGNFSELGRLMYVSHASLRHDFGVSTARLDCFVDCARAAGALGARLTGAGFGGSAIALVPHDRKEFLVETSRQAFLSRDFGEPAFLSVAPTSGARVVG